MFIEERIWSKLLNGKTPEIIIKEGSPKYFVDAFIKEWGWLVVKVLNKLNLNTDGIILPEAELDLYHLREEGRNEFYCKLCQHYIELEMAFQHIVDKHPLPSIPSTPPSSIIMYKTIENLRKWLNNYDNLHSKYVELGR